MTSGERSAIRGNLGKMKDALQRFDDAIAHDRVDYRYAAIQLMDALERIGTAERLLRAARAKDPPASTLRHKPGRSGRTLDVRRLAIRPQHEWR